MHNHTHHHYTHHIDHQPHDRSGRRRRGPGGHGRGRGEGRRATRGAVAQSILVLLAEQPRHGYEPITALEERSGGRWRPSPGAVYPALRKLEDRGLISAVDDDGKTRYELTETGTRWVESAAEVGYREPWAEAGIGRRGDLNRALGELTGPVRQIARYGTPEQQAGAQAALQQATRTLYELLATPPAAEAPARDETDQ